VLLCANIYLNVRRVMLALLRQILEVSLPNDFEPHKLTGCYERCLRVGDVTSSDFQETESDRCEIQECPI
jgi:hypothetical protein